MDKAAASVRLFLVPGMQHCSGGIGPDQFDTLSAIEAWVEHGKAPDAIAAHTKSGRRSAAQPAALPVPAAGALFGHGALDDAANWKCMAPGHETARSGHSAGAG